MTDFNYLKLIILNNLHYMLISLSLEHVKKFYNLRATMKKSFMWEGFCQLGRDVGLCAIFWTKIYLAKFWCKCMNYDLIVKVISYIFSHIACVSFRKWMWDETNKYADIDSWWGKVCTDIWWCVLELYCIESYTCICIKSKFWMLMRMSKTIWAATRENQQCGFWSGLTQTRLYSYWRWPEAWNFRFSK